MNLIYNGQFCSYVCTYVHFNSSEITGRVNIKLGTIDHHLGEHHEGSQILFEILHFLTEKNRFVLKQKLAPDQSPYKIFHLFRV